MPHRKYSNILSVGLILFLTIMQSSAVTDLTYMNCPDGYDVTVANVTKQSDGIVKFMYSAYDTPEFKAKIQAIIIEGKDSELSALITQMLIPFILVLVAFFIFFMIIICCTVFEKSCPPCESWRRDFIRRPYEKFQMRCVTIFAIIFSTSIFVLAIVMFTSFPVLKQQLKYTQCSLFNMLDITKNGEQTKQWGGFSQLKNQVGNISSLLSSASSEVNKNFKGFDGLSNDDWIINDMQAMKKATLDIYRNNKDSKVATPDPTRTASAAAGTTPVTDSLFITTGMGPNGTANTMVTDIDTALRKTQTLSQQAYLIQKQCTILVDSVGTITANTNASQQTLTMYQTQLSQIQVTLNKFSADMFAKVFDWGLYIIEGVVGFVLAGSVFILFGVISTHVLDILACRTMVNLGWVIYGLMYFGIIILVFIFLQAGSIAYGFCSYFDGMVTNQTQFNKISQTDSQNPFTKLDVCLYGDGNVLSKFHIAEEMQTVTDVFTNIQTYFDYQNPTSVSYINKELSAIKIQSWIDTMQKYRVGVYIDANPSLTTQDNHVYALQNLNKQTKYFYPNGTRHPSCPRDIWVFDTTNCTDPNAQIYKSTTQQSNGLRFTLLNDLCLSFNQKFISSYGNIWNLNDFTKRYQQTIHSCPAYSEMIRYGRSLMNYRDSRINLFQGLKDQLTALLNKHKNFTANLNLYKGRVDAFYSSVSTLNNLVTDKISGLLVSSDCNVIGDYLKVTNNVFCKNVIRQAAVLGICSVLMLCVLIGGIITASVFSVRYARIQTIEKHNKRAVLPQSSIHSQTFQKKQDSDSSSSSSSDQD